jgi:malto-oligosyltrehalose trehalohydrolase
MMVPDPASRFQPSDVHGPSQVVDPERYAWRNDGWIGRPWEEAVLYEAHLGAFSPEGGFDGMRRRLDYLAKLGITAVELMPIADFDGRRNWGYDGVLLFAPDAAYGTPDDLKRLVDEAHGRGLMMLLDVVYNHFGPSGNFLGRYAPGFFTQHRQTPWGPALDYSDRRLRDFVVHNALYWLDEYRFDGLRLDAVHAIRDETVPDILEEIALSVRSRLDGRKIHLVLENDDNRARYLAREPASRPRHYTAQWNDDFHHAAHVVATGEDEGYYGDYSDGAVRALARALAEGFAYQGEVSRHRGGVRRGETSAHLPPTAFVNFLQNHDQIGNRGFGERLAALAEERAVRALTAILLLSAQIPLLFMGEEWGSERPFLFFCAFTGELAEAVREGRKREFAHRGDATELPDPIAESSFTRSALDWDASERERGRRRIGYVRRLLALRREAIVPRLAGIAGGGSYEVRGGQALLVRWRLADGARLTLAANLSSRASAGLGWHLPDKLLYAEPADERTRNHLDHLAPWAVCFTLDVSGETR